MTFNIPPTLVTELASQRCLIFAGSGLSRQSVGEDGTTRPPTWPELLAQLLTIAAPDDQPRGTSLIGENRLLDAAEVMLSNHNPAEFHRIIGKVFKTPRFQPSHCHSAIVRIDPKIVVTTNYDTLLEQAYTASAVDHAACRQYEEHAVNVVRSDQRLVLKAHGCVTNPRNIVLSRSDYFKARRSNQQFYALLDALFLVHTIFFVGYGLQDPDIQLVLENAHIRSPSDHPHYVLMANGTDPAILQAMTKSYNIRPLMYDNTSGTHAECQLFLDELAKAVESERA